MTSPTDSPRGEVKLSPAARTALAFVLATGWTPKHIHLSTWAVVNAAIEGDAPRKRVKPEFMAEVATEPLAKAHAYLIGLGYRVDSHGRQGRGTSHYVAYSHPDRPDEALAGRDGGVTLIKVQDVRPYRQSVGISAAEVNAALKATENPA